MSHSFVLKVVNKPLLQITEEREPVLTMHSPHIADSLQDFIVNDQEQEKYTKIVGSQYSSI